MAWMDDKYAHTRFDFSVAQVDVGTSVLVAPLSASYTGPERRLFINHLHVLIEHGVDGSTYTVRTRTPSGGPGTVIASGDAGVVGVDVLIDDEGRGWRTPDGTDLHGLEVEVSGGNGVSATVRVIGSGCRQNA